jgi:hypothetical protein
MKFSTGEIQGYHSGKWDAALIVIQGNEADLGMHCVLDRPVTLGRDTDAELPLRDVGISRRHAMVEKDVLGRYVVSDLGSTNGTRVNGDILSAPRSPAISSTQPFLSAKREGSSPYKPA